MTRMFWIDADIWVIHSKLKYSPQYESFKVTRVKDITTYCELCENISTTVIKRAQMITEIHHSSNIDLAPRIGVWKNQEATQTHYF